MNFFAAKMYRSPAFVSGSRATSLMSDLMWSFAASVSEALSHFFHGLQNIKPFLSFCEIKGKRV